MGFPSGEVFTKAFPSVVQTPSSNQSLFLSVAFFTNLWGNAVGFSFIKMCSEATLAGTEALGNNSDN